MSTTFFKTFSDFWKSAGLHFPSIIYTHPAICLFLFPWSILKLSENLDNISCPAFFVHSQRHLSIIWIHAHMLHFSMIKYAVRESCRTILIICPFIIFWKLNYLKIQCTCFLPTFPKLSQNSSVRVPLRLQKFFKSKFFKTFSKSKVYVYLCPQKTFLKVSFLKESLIKNVYVYLSEHMFDFSNKISDRLFYYISNAYIL